MSERVRVLCGAGVLLAAAHLAAADTIVVMQDGSGDAKSITGGVILANAGDSVLVGPGVYAEEVVIETSLTLVGRDGPSVTTIDASAASHCVVCPVEVEALVLAGLTLANAQAAYAFDSGYAIRGVGTLAVENCVITDNGGGGLFWFGNVQLTGVEAKNMGMVRDAVFVSTGDMFEVGGSRFHDIFGHVLANRGGVLNVTDSRFLSLGPNEGASIATAGDVSVAHCVFWSIDGVGIGPYAPPVRSRRAMGPVGASVSVLGSTFARVDQGAIVASESVPLVTLDRNIITGGSLGIVNTGKPPESMICNNVWGNTSNWFGMGSPEGIDGNISMPPLYCGPSVGDLHLASNSPCLPMNNSCGVLIGALGEGCGVTSVESMSWGRLKETFR